MASFQTEQKQLVTKLQAALDVVDAMNRFGVQAEFDPALVAACQQVAAYASSQSTVRSHGAAVPARRWAKFHTVTMIAEAVRHLGSTVNAAAVTSEMVNRGWQTTGERPANLIASGLTLLASDPESPVVRVGRGKYRWSADATGSSQTDFLSQDEEASRTLSEEERMTDGQEQEAETKEGTPTGAG